MIKHIAYWVRGVAYNHNNVLQLLPILTKPRDRDEVEYEIELFGSEPVWPSVITTNVLIEAEPDNEFDPNAQKVIVEGYHVGYIPKGRASTVRKQIDQSPYRLAAFIKGGPLYHKEYKTPQDGDFSIKLHILLGEQNQLNSIQDIDDFIFHERWKKTDSATTDNKAPKSNEIKEIDMPIDEKLIKAGKAMENAGNGMKGFGEGLYGCGCAIFFLPLLWFLLQFLGEFFG